MPTVSITLFKPSWLIIDTLFIHIVLKVGVKRRRTREQIADEKNEAALKEKAIKDKLAMLSGKEQEMKSNAAAAEILENMIKSGVAVQEKDGSISVPSASK